MPLNTSTGFAAVTSFARTADANAYTANDVVGSATTSGGAVLTLTTGGGGHVMITDASLRIDVTSVPAGMTSFRLYLYDATPGSALGDNGAWDLPSGDRSAFHGYVDLGTPVDLGSTLYVQATGINKKFKLAEGATALYGYLVTAAGFTPGSGDVFTVRLAGIGV